MKAVKIYEAHDKMITLINDNYNVLQSLSAFGISLGFGEKTVEETCFTNRVDTTTFLAVVNMTINGEKNYDLKTLSVGTLLHYLEACHRYYLDYQLPFVRKELSESIYINDKLGKLILQMYDEYAQEIRKHMNYEERMLFPYVRGLMNGQSSTTYDIDTFVKHHDEAEKSLKELKSLIIKYLPSDIHNSNKLTSTLFLIHNNEEWLANHQEVEDSMFVPLVKTMEENLKNERINEAISAFANADAAEEAEVLSDREKDVIVSVVQGMSNKEIGEHLCISVNTVITHRKHIAKKLQIHSPAGLTIYAIVNGLVRIDNL